MSRVRLVEMCTKDVWNVKQEPQELSAHFVIYQTNMQESAQLNADFVSNRQISGSISPMMAATAAL